LEPRISPELDKRHMLGEHETALYMSMIGAVVAFGRMDIFASTVTVSGFRYPKISVKLRTEIPDY